MRDKLGFPTPQLTGGISHQEVVDIVDNRLHNAHSAIEMRLSLLDQHVGIDFIDDSTPHPSIETELKSLQRVRDRNAKLVDESGFWAIVEKETQC